MNKILKYYKYVKKYRLIMLSIFILSMISSIFNLLKTCLLSVIIDTVLEQKNINLLKNILVVMLVLLVLDLLISYVVGYLNTYVTQVVSIKLRKDMLKKILNVKIKFLNENKSGDFISRIKDDINIISDFLCNKPITVLNSLCTAIVTLVGMIFINKTMAILAIVVVIVQIIISLLLSKISRNNQREIRINDSLHIGMLKQIFSSVKYIRAYRVEHANERKYYKFTRNLLNLNFKAYFISFIYGSINALLTFFGSMIVFVVGVLLVYNGSITIGILFVFDGIIDILYSNINSIVSVFLEANKAAISFLRIEEINLLEVEDNSGKAIESSIEKIEYRNINFSYSDKPLLENLKLIFEKGKTYAIVGESGIGKSTLTNLLLKFYEPQSGALLINNTDIKDILAKDIRDRISIVFQDGCIIDGTIYDNILFGNKNVSTDKVEKICKICLMDDFVSGLPNGYKTHIEEYGTNLSGGQKQRIFVARALLNKSDVYIFDEAFSQMDKNLEFNIMNSIQSYYSDKIVIFITHNINIIKHIENIVILENNNRIITGNHDFVFQNSEIYREFCEKG